MNTPKDPSSSKYDNFADGDDAVSQSKFFEGDIFYTYFDNRFHINKLLKFEQEFDTYHILSYEAVKQLPTIEEIENMKISGYHMPVDKNGFENPMLLTKSKVLAADLIGYHEFIRQTHETEDMIAIANNYYNNGNHLADEKKFEEAIDEYSKAIDLIPLFFEAIDNRAFSKMDLARWAEAVEDFELSLKVYPENASAEFSIGECYLRKKDYTQAQEHFEKALIIDPAHQLSKDFIEAIESEKSVD